MDHGLEMGSQPVGGLLGLGKIPIHTRRDGDEMQVVAVIHAGIDALRTTALDVGFIGASGCLVGADCGIVVAGADINVGRHVDDMSGGRGQSGQSVRAGQCSFRGRRGFHRVNVVVNCSQVVGISFNYRLQRGDDFVCAFQRGAVLLPKSPRVEVHA